MSIKIEAENTTKTAPTRNLQIINRPSIDSGNSKSKIKNQKLFLQVFIREMSGLFLLSEFICVVRL
jgi:hypothetical protein